MCLATDLIHDLVFADLVEDATKIAVTQGAGDLSSFVLSYLQVAVDWKSISNELQTRAIET